MHERDHLWAKFQFFLKVVLIQCSVLQNRHRFYPGSLFRGQHLPGHNVRVVLHIGDQNDVTLAYVLAAPRLCNQVDAVCGACHPNNFLQIRRPDVVLHR